MSSYEYKVVPAPKKGLKVKGAKTSQDRFAIALETQMNELGAEGWEYQRTDTLPCEERAGLTGRVTTFQHMLVFRRPLDAAQELAPAAPVTEQDDTVAPAEAETPEVTAEPEADTPREDAKVAAE